MECIFLAVLSLLEILMAANRCRSERWATPPASDVQDETSQNFTFKKSLTPHQAISFIVAMKHLHIHNQSVSDVSDDQFTL